MMILKRIAIDALLVFSGLVFITSIRAVMPPRLPLSFFPADFGLPFEEIMLQTSDGVDIAGWFVYSPDSKGVVICLHGYPANKSDILPSVKFLFPDFSLLLLDFRAHGASGGRVVHFGLKEHLEVKAAIDFIKEDKRAGNLPVGIWGYSFGGAVGIISAALYDEIDAVASDSAFANFPEMITSYYKNTGPLRHFFSYASGIMGRILLRGDFYANSPENFISKVDVPILIIHSRDDRLVPLEHAQRLFDRASGEKKLWISEGEHSSARSSKTGYREILSDFFFSITEKGKHVLVSD